MSHPMNHLRADKIERSRVKDIVKGFARGGAVEPEMEDDDRPETGRKAMRRGGKSEEKMEGKAAKHHMGKRKRGGKVACADGGVVPISGYKKGGKIAKGEKTAPMEDDDRPQRAYGGNVKRKTGQTIVNVMMGDKGQQAPPQQVPIKVPVPVPAPPPPMAGPPPGMPPQGMPPGGPPPGAMPPPGMMGRAKGGRVKRDDGGAVSTYRPRTNIQTPEAQAARARAMGTDSSPFSQAAGQQDMQGMLGGIGNGGTSSSLAEQQNRKRGGKVTKGTPTYEDSLRNGTQVSHSPGKNDLNDLKIKSPIVPTRPPYAMGGATKSEGMKRGPRMDAGAGSGEGRLDKIGFQKRR